ncbi:MAG TPA: hypothetical protein VLF59_04100 [Candidatus Saccharimonadales bacterium]|nr:hypothetical protein [Candidatus Saccharimonadales bacterium]
MSSNTAHLPTNPLQTINKRVLIAVTGFVVAAVVGATTLVGAQPLNKPTKAWCTAHGFTNYGQCVKEWAHGHGYGGNTNTANTNINVSTHGNHNAVSIVINYIFGS